MQNERARVQQAIVDGLRTVTSKPVEGIDADTDLVSDLALDSLQVMNLMMEIEDQLDITIATEVLGDLRRVRDLTDYALGCLDARGDRG